MSAFGIVVGTDDARARAVVAELYRPLYLIALLCRRFLSRTR
jgi:hypothetical protein